MGSNSHSRLSRSALLILVASIFMPALSYGLTGGSFLTVVGASVFVVLVTVLILKRNRMSQILRRSRSWTLVSRVASRPGQLKWTLVLALYVLLAATPPLFGGNQPPRLDSFALTFGVWAVIFGFFYMIFWMVDSLLSWRRRLATPLGVSSTSRD